MHTAKWNNCIWSRLMQNLLISHQDSAGPSFHVDQMLKRWGIKQPFYIVRSANLHWFNYLFPTEKCLEIHERTLNLKTYSQTRSTWFPSLLSSSFARLCRNPLPTTEILMRSMSTQVWSESPGVCWYIRCALLCCGCEVHLEAALGWDLLFSSVRHEARALIRTHLLVRETPRVWLLLRSNQLSAAL